MHLKKNMIIAQKFKMPTQCIDSWPIADYLMVSSAEHWLKKHYVIKGLCHPTDNLSAHQEILARSNYSGNRFTNMLNKGLGSARVIHNNAIRFFPTKCQCFSKGPLWALVFYWVQLMGICISKLPSFIQGITNLRKWSVCLMMHKVESCSKLFYLIQQHSWVG